MDPTGIFFLYVIASPQAECQARVNVNATHGTKTRVAYVSLHLMGSSRSIYPAGITIGILLFASPPDCGQNQTAVSDEQQSLFDF